MAPKGKESKRQTKKEGKGTQPSKRGSRNQQTTSKKESETNLARREQFSPARATVSPFSLMRRFSEEMDRLFGDFSVGAGFAPGFGRELGRLDLDTSLWLPQVEAFERDGQLIVRADLPGLTKDDINVNITDDAIENRGERLNEKAEDEEGYYRSREAMAAFIARFLCQAA
jgi:HSP20 family protein